MFIWMLDPEIWLTLVTLTFLEIILGVDNIIFLSLVVAKLPPHQQNMARKLGLGGAMVMRVLLLVSIAWLAHITVPLFTIANFVVSVRTIILFVGGCFLIYKSLQEIRGELMQEEESHGGSQGQISLAGAIVQIMLLDIVFSLDSVITAVGLSQHIFIMITAVIIAVGIMMFAAKTIGDFVNNTPTMKMLALTFLLLVGALLVADSLEVHIAKGYLYFAIFFSLTVETLNIVRTKKIIKASQQDEAYDSLQLNK
ncbi:TerC family protein [Klebsiella sp. RHBSTW-00484]|uniref:TerC family protein n=1 Tax=unclassified Klebsiella TaxID=2608929 RepID=UPI0015E5952C|nr:MULTISPECIES: TerC family protein [unclassified Klebsiella]MBA7847267.1 TerC family protein [Klebsiella sp. RHBSTW-00465]QLO36847.1 TerC family protein [Klebsiella sp. RHBSTW-00484]QLT76365.1 TerC family protein [Klebsiella sp. RHBSTW-00464]